MALKRLCLGLSVVVVTIVSCIFLLSFQKNLGVNYAPSQVKNFIKVFLSEGRHAQQKIAPNTQLIYSYFKLALKPLVSQSSRVKSTSFLDLKITFFDYPDLQQLFSEIFIQNNYFFSATSINPFIIDCGSNIGISILYFKKLYPQAKIIGFEPSSECFNVLTKNITDNNISQVTLHKKALSNKNGFCYFFDTTVGNGALNASILSDKETQQQSPKVVTARLSDFIVQPVDLLKIDIEGAERMVLEELDQSGKIHWIKEMVIEYHHHIPKTNEDVLSSFLAILEKNNFGYQIRNSGINHPFGKATSQGIIIYAYAKNKSKDMMPSLDN